MTHELAGHAGTDDSPNARPPRLACDTTDVGSGAVWVHVAGELDLWTSPRLERTLRDRSLRAAVVVLDLRGVTFMDVAGARIIADASRRARRLGRRLFLLRGAPHVDRVLSLSRIDEELEIGGVAPVAVPGAV